MSTAFIYLLKLSVSLGVVFLFYQLVLRRLTFYNWNRWYLLGYSLLSFIIPFIDISPALHQNELTNSTVVQWVPVLYNKSITTPTLSSPNILSLLIITGMLVMLIRFLIQLISFRRMMKKAILISGEDINLYQVNESIIPFSFGNAVFINRHLHTAEELEEIIRHEFVHVKQRHSIDIIAGELLCLLNWYNPFAWLLKKSIRQNLEFIADNKVLENGVSKKEYQYLLLKVIGSNQYSIAAQFNFSSLKKRIAMMNKNKSAKMHLLRFLFLLPVLAVILVSFRKEIRDTLKGKQKQLQIMPGLSITDNTDTIPDITDKNDKGYIISVKDNNGNCLLVIKDKDGKEVKRLLLTEWNKNAEKYEALYGELPPPPPPSDAYLAKTISEEEFLSRNKEIKKVGWVFHYDNKIAIVHLEKKDGTKEDYNLDKETERAEFEKKYGSIPYPPPPPPSAPTPVEIAIAPPPPSPPTPPVPAELPENVKKISISNGKATVTLKNGEKENYDLSNPVQKAKFESKYENIPPPPPVAAGITGNESINRISSEYEITDKKAVIKLKNGTVEKYDLTNKTERSAFEKKYGKIINVATTVNSNVNTNVQTDIKTNVTTNLNTNVKTTVNSSINMNVDATVTPVPVTNLRIVPSKKGVALAPLSAKAVSTTTPIKLKLVKGYGVSALAPIEFDNPVGGIDATRYMITGKEDIVITITGKTTPDQLEQYKKQMKEKGVELSFDDVDYENGKLVKITGTMKSGGSRSNFVAVDFRTLTLAMIRKEDKTWFKVNTTDNREVI